MSHSSNSTSSATAILRIVADRSEGERLAADEIESLLKAKPDAALGLATGGTMTGLYDELSRRHAAGRVSFARAKGFNLDEYLGLAPADPRSFAAYMRASLLERVDFAPGAARLPRGDAPDAAAESKGWEEAIAAAGLTRQALHAAILGFVHPVTRESLRFETTPPEDMRLLEEGLAGL